jgi:hypothetical protein
LTKKGWEKFKIIQKGEKFVSKFRSKGRGTGEGGFLEQFKSAKRPWQEKTTEQTG